ncbi:hypothetical protein F5Y19DRAFT_445708 [Xylariaceae sp. FL1651]|nr:hypothetical protein F5Y19DRAFT_445708 [Xylariaceae sp. FL1651]
MEGEDWRKSMKSHFQLRKVCYMFDPEGSANKSLVHVARLNGYIFTHVRLHGLPWLNMAALKRIIPAMPNLEALTVSQCFLLNFGATKSFVKLINKTNVERADLTLPWLEADFIPFYFKGPKYKQGGHGGHVGEYGILPEDNGTFDTTRAVAAHLLKIWALCAKGRQDFFTPGKGFRAFLDMLPWKLYTLPTILKAISNIHDFNEHVHHSAVANLAPRYTTGAQHRDGDDKPPVISPELKMAMELTLWQDLMVACNGRPMVKTELQDILVVRGALSLDCCRKCDTRMPAYFFQAHILSRRAEYVICHGCQLSTYLKDNIYRLYSQRRDLAKMIFKRDERECSLRHILKKAKPGAIPKRFAGMTDALWHGFKDEIPAYIEKIHRGRYELDLQRPHLSHDDQIANYDARKKLERKELWEEFQLGLSQRVPELTAGVPMARSWEFNIRQYRADLALQTGDLVNSGPIPVYNANNAAVKMLDFVDYTRENMDPWSQENEGTRAQTSCSAASASRGSAISSSPAENGGSDNAQSSSSNNTKENGRGTPQEELCLDSLSLSENHQQTGTNLTLTTVRNSFSSVISTVSDAPPNVSQNELSPDVTRPGDVFIHRNWGEERQQRERSETERRMRGGRGGRVGPRGRGARS